MRLWLGGALLALGLTWGAVHAQTTLTTATIRTVSDCSGAPVPDTEVTANGQYLGMTDAAGDFTAPAYTGTVYALVLWNGYYSPWHGSISTDGPIVLTVTLHRIGPGC